MTAAHKSSTTNNAELPAAEVLSFLKDTRSSPTWTESELAKSLNVTPEQAQQTLPVLQLAGYIEPVGRGGKWRTTEQGELIAGSTAPKFTRESIERALASLTERIESINQDNNAPYRITQAVGFGDFLSDRARVQAADVGIDLQSRASAGGADKRTAANASQDKSFLNRLRGRSTTLRIQEYASWMSHRSHRKLI
jgi:predicted ArsR family transcriptional regulator